LALQCSPEYEKEVKDIVNGERKVTERKDSMKYDKEVKGALAEATECSEPIESKVSELDKVSPTNSILSEKKCTELTEMTLSKLEMVVRTEYLQSEKVKVIVAETTEIVESSGNLLQSEKEVKVVSAETTGKVESSDNLLESEKEVIVGVAETTEYTEPVETKVSELEKVESSEDLSLLENVLIDDSGTIVTQLTEFETVVPFEDLVIGENVQIMNKEYSKCYVTQSTQQKEDANETISVEPYQEVVKAETALERFDRDLLFVYPFIGGVEIENLAEK
jgi:hypothetical protein